MSKNQAKKTPLADWHPADIIAGLHKRGHSMRRLSVANGYHERSLNEVLRRSWRKGEQIVAEALDVQPCEIWPSRYNEAAELHRKAWGRTTNNSSVIVQCNVKESDGVKHGACS